MKALFKILSTLVFFSACYAEAGVVHSLRTTVSGNVAASVKGQDSTVKITTESVVEVDASLNASFSAGSLTCVRQGRVVTITVNEDLAHSSLSSVVGANLIPEGFRPSATIFNTYISSRAASGNYVKRLQVEDSGTVRFEYVDWAGALSPQTFTGVFTLTYIVD